ncbi:hypothetical protein Tco_0363099 [Tanacetum coccineum]
MSFITFQDCCLLQKLLGVYVLHVNDASESSKPSWGNTCTLLLHLVWFVKYSACVRRTVADLLHVPPNGYSPRPNVMIQYRSSIRWCDTDGWLGEADSELRQKESKKTLKTCCMNMGHGYAVSSLMDTAYWSSE